jgi:hypothetical protein
MKESGVRIPGTHLVDPHAAIRSIRRGKRMLPLLMWKEKKLRRTLAGRAAVPPPVSTPAAPQINRGVEVF